MFTLRLTSDENDTEISIRDSDLARTLGTMARVANSPKPQEAMASRMATSIEITDIHPGSHCLGSKIHVIKAIRGLTGMDLRTSKDIADNVFAGTTHAIYPERSYPDNYDESFALLAEHANFIARFGD